MPLPEETQVQAYSSKFVARDQVRENKHKGRKVPPSRWTGHCTTLIKVNKILFLDKGLQAWRNGFLGAFGRRRAVKGTTQMPLTYPTYNTSFPKSFKGETSQTNRHHKSHEGYLIESMGSW